MRSDTETATHCLEQQKLCKENCSAEHIEQIACRSLSSNRNGLKPYTNQDVNTEKTKLSYFAVDCGTMAITWSYMWAR